MTTVLANETVGLHKSFGTVRVLAGIDLSVPRGQVFALLGPNGAGKTTMVRILATLTRPDAGVARVAGYDVVRQRREVRRNISLTGQSTAIDEMQTGEENLRMMARLAGVPRSRADRRAGELLELFELAEAGRRRVATYSGGMRRRLDLAAGLVGEPKVIFLDEPTTGLDPRSRQVMWQRITRLTGAGTTVLLTTQYLEEADQLADHIVVVDAGRVVAGGSPATLKKQFAEQRLDLTLVDDSAFVAVSGRLGDRVIRQDAGRRFVAVQTDGDAAGIRVLLDEVDPMRTAVRSFTVRTATLDDVFLALTGHAATTKEVAHV
jgi:ABC-2 type transport system ATP-binding protein